MEVNSLQAAAEDFGDQGVQVFGISFDDVKTQAKFAKDQNLSYRLLSDTDGSAAGKYDVGMDGRPFARRVTFVIDDEGTLKAIIDSVNVRSHGEDLVATLDDLME